MRTVVVRSIPESAPTFSHGDLNIPPFKGRLDGSCWLKARTLGQGRKDDQTEESKLSREEGQGSRALTRQAGMD